MVELNNDDEANNESDENNEEETNDNNGEQGEHPEIDEGTHVKSNVIYSMIEIHFCTEHKLR